MSDATRERGAGRSVCHVTTAHPALDTRIFRRECRSLAAAGYRVQLVAPHPGTEIIDGVRILPLPAPPSGMARRLVWPILAARRAASTRADLYHFHDPELIPAMSGLGRWTGRPVVWDAHEVYAETIAHFNQLGWRPASVAGARLFGRYELHAARRSFAGVVTITEMMAERYRRAGILTAVVGNLVEDELLDPGSTVPPPRARPPLLVTTGQLNPDRGILLMVEAFDRVRHRHPCRLAFWGHFPREEDERRLRDLIRARGLEAEVSIGGPYPRGHLLDTLLPTATAACVLLLERSDYNIIGVPNRLTEYWARGLPVIASRDTCAGQMTADVQAGLLADHTAESLAQCFEQVLRDPEAARAMGERGRRAVAERFNWRFAFANLLDLYDRVLGPPPP
ncbi:MAG TPA: glycosyltransferase [Gemmatimonadales bacterium]|nr:glycosyltransferase [Gemmatimonadales bacterium]